MNKKSQVILEAVVSFVFICIFVLGIVNLWMWSDKQNIERQLSYNGTRVSAGSSGSLQYPVYTPQQLDEDKIIGDNPFE
ncbi:MAG: hypothetical protein K9L61_00610 [Candidatus Omnitrophica bacterium]|nr:hypothetical protein [Candidatus Omnitrophota bacterium]